MGHQILSDVFPIEPQDFPWSVMFCLRKKPLEGLCFDGVDVVGPANILWMMMLKYFDDLVVVSVCLCS